MPERQTNEAGAAGNRTPVDWGTPRPQASNKPRRTSPIRLRNWPLRAKQIIVILVPTLTALLLGYLRISTELAKADEFSRAITQVNLSASIAGLAHDIQGERDLVVGRVASGRNDDRDAIAEQIDKTDRGIKKLRDAAGSIRDLDSAVQTRYSKVVAGLDTLDALRVTAEQTRYPAADTLTTYESIIGSLLQLNREITRVSDDRTISEQADRIDAIANAKEQLAIQNSILRGAVLADAFQPGQLARLRSAQAEFAAELTAFRESADSAALVRYANTVAGPEVDDRLRLQQIALNRGDAGTPINLNVTEVDAAAKGTLDKLKNVETASLDDLRTTARDLVATARNNAVRDAAFILAALVVALLLMLVVARSLLKPLRVLRRDALDVANRRLPATVERILADPDPLTASKNAVEPVPLFTTEEVGQVARSFDAVQHQAVRMATEQAMLRDNINSIFVNLSRRSQTLVERQLALIDQLEQDEQDPDQLAHLFELDHLATRMRRNSESLLVLSGSGLTRQLNRHVPASEVVGAAISEVEQYVRIEVTTAPEVQVQGRAVSDLVHLIAELLDNATYFSEPDKKVKVRMVVTRVQELLIQITDHGVGMAEEEIKAANERLADPPDLDVAVTRRMGLYVVARLAKRHNIVVRLRDNEDLEGGLITRIVVPSELISFPPTSTATQPSAMTGTFDRLPTRTTATDVYGAVAARPQVDTRRPTPPIRPALTSGLGESTRIVRNAEPVASDDNERPRPARTSLFDELQQAPLGTGGEAGAPNIMSVMAGRELEQAAIAADPPTGRLPIYEDVLTQWFAIDPESRNDMAEPADGKRLPAEGSGTGSPTPGPADAGSWTSAGDEGWQAARTLLGNGVDSVTATGLPKRIPKARLIPGSAAPRHERHTEDAPSRTETMRVTLPPRSASAARSQLSSYQQGLRRGRRALIGDQAGAGDNQQREQE